MCQNFPGTLQDYSTHHAEIDMIINIASSAAHSNLHGTDQFRIFHSQASKRTYHIDLPFWINKLIYKIDVKSAVTSNPLN